MGWTDDLKGNLGQTLDPGNLLGVGGSKGPAGLSGPLESHQAGRLQPRPDGTFFDPVSGTTYADEWGNTPLAAPNVTQQVQTNALTGRDFLDRNAVQDARGTTAYNGQKAFGDDLNQVIRNPNAPTVSTAVMDQAIGNIDRQQLAGVAGAGGVNAAAARRQALSNMGNLDLQAAGQGAIARATEAAGARQAQATNLQNMAGNSLEATGQNNQGAAAFSGLADKGAEANQTATMQNNEKNMQQKQGFLGGIGGGIMKML